MIGEIQHIPWELVLGISSILTALLALRFTDKQTELSRQHNRLSVRPHLSINYRIESDSFGRCFELANNGTGPAIIKATTVFLSGTP